MMKGILLSQGQMMNNDASSIVIILLPYEISDTFYSKTIWQYIILIKWCP